MEVVSKPCQDGFLHPILVHSLLEKKENIGSQMGHTKKIFKKGIFDSLLTSFEATMIF
jgi:hypothetical protein